MKHRRRVPRQHVGLEGTCHIEGEATTWPCLVVDTSMLGLGMTLKHPSPSDLCGCRISVHVHATDDSGTTRYEGVVVNVVPTAEGAVRLGVAFDGFAEPEPGAAGRAEPGEQARRGQTSSPGAVATPS
jgi:hypothetical protein